MCALINLDHLKAFDRIDYCYLEVVLNAGGFGLLSRGWLIAIHSGTCSGVNVSSYLLELFGIACSVHQGSTLAPLLYVLALEQVGTAKEHPFRIGTKKSSVGMRIRCQCHGIGCLQSGDSRPHVVKSTPSNIYG